MSVPSAFDLAAYEAHKVKGQPLAPSPLRRKQDKFGILDARTHHYDEDFRQGIGMLGTAVIFFDLDNFKAINTRFTEPVVDRELLTHLNKLVAALTKDRGFAYAEGGDEFLILLPNTSVKLAEAFVQELLAKLRAKQFAVNGQPVKVTASAGISWSLDPDKAQACLEAAALAKKEAKDQGRDRYVIAPTMGETNEVTS
jgi:diguanylate cyclase (GGDEF)-like protein